MAADSLTVNVSVSDIDEFKAVTSAAADWMSQVTDPSHEATPAETNLFAAFVALAESGPDAS